MRSPVHAYLDGEVALETLTPSEREEALMLERMMQRLAGELHAQPVPDLAPQVMAGLPATPVSAPRVGSAFSWLGKLAAWLWNPRLVRLRPAYGLGAAVLLALAFIGVRYTSSSDPSAQAAAVDASPVYVQFRLEAPTASRVTLAGSFTNWQPLYDLHQTAPGVWSVMVPLPPGVYDYTFVVDGSRWIPDPHAPQVPDSFGGTNSRLTLLPPRSDT